MIGSSALDAMIGMKEITKISILSRGPVKMAEDAKDPRINVITHKDFAQYDSEVLTQLKGASGCVWALGVSQTKVSKDDYVKITRDWPAEAAKAFQALTPENEPFNFVYVSGVGATTEPGLFSAFWARIKGEAELALADIRKENPLLRASSVRLGFGSEAKHDAIKPYLPSRPYYEKVLRASEPAIRAVMPSIWTPTEYFGRFLTDLALGRYQDQLRASKGIRMVGNMPIIENSAFRRLVEIK